MALWLVAFLLAPLALGQQAHDDELPPLRIAQLTYANGKKAICFSPSFLQLANEQSTLEVAPAFDEVALTDPLLVDYPFVIMSGEGSFVLSDAEREQLKAYLQRGFLVASAGCSSQPWALSFRKEMHALYPDAELVRLEADHPVYHMLYDIEQSQHSKGAPRLPHLEALTLDGRVAVIFCPDGLNDTDALGGACCCCGGNEVRAAPQLNVNLLLYALTH